MKQSSRQLLQAVLLILPLTAAHAGPLLEIELAACASKANDKERLTCYDLTYTRFAERINEAVEAGSEDNWQVETSPSLLNTGSNITLKLVAEQPVKSRTQTVTPQLEISCIDNRSTLSIHWGVYLGKNRTTMTTRIDDGETVTTDWLIEDKYTVRQLKNTEQFIRQLQNKRRLIAQISPYNASPVVASFKLNQLNQHIESYAISCEW